MRNTPSGVTVTDTGSPRSARAVSAETLPFSSFASSRATSFFSMVALSCIWAVRPWASRSSFASAGTLKLSPSKVAVLISPLVSV